jgi:hypothetical protein
MRHPKHQKYWFFVASGFGGLGIAMIAAAVVLAGPTQHLPLTGPFMIVAYLAFACTAVCFFCGIRQMLFPFAVNDPEVPEKPPVVTGSGTGEYLPKPPTWDEVDDDLKKLKESREQREDK